MQRSPKTVFLSLVASALLACTSEVVDTDEKSEALTVESAACRVDYVVTGSWGNGFGADVTITNKGAAKSTWTLEWSYPSGQRVTSLWNGSVTQSGAVVTVRDAGWNGALATGASVKFGMNGSLSGANDAPAGFRLNGVSCEGTSGGGGSSSGGGATTGGSSSAGGSTTGGSTSGGGTTASGGTSSTSCAPAYVAGTAYQAGDRVTSGGKVYECRAYPYSGWCPLAGYAPGTGAYSADAWIDRGTCSSGSGGSSSGGSTSGGGTSSGGGSGGTSSCTFPAWQAGRSYVPGNIVSYQGALYIAEQANPGYDPVISTWFWDPYTGGCTGGTGGGTSTGGTSSGGSTSTGGTSSGGSTSTGLGSVLSRADFVAMFPNRNAFYSYEGLLEAAAKFPAFAQTGDVTTRRQEIAAFLANVGHETGDLVYIEEIAKGEYCDSSPWFCPCASGKRYFGRGLIQLSWNYNYCSASQSLFGDREILRQDPDRVARESWVAWATALWFWMTQTGAGSMTCHSAMVNQRSFGETIRTINGGLECNGANPGQVQSRIDRYRAFTSRLGTTTGSNLGC